MMFGVIPADTPPSVRDTASPVCTVSCCSRPASYSRHDREVQAQLVLPVSMVQRENHLIVSRHGVWFEEQEVRGWPAHWPAYILRRKNTMGVRYS